MFLVVTGETESHGFGETQTLVAPPFSHSSLSNLNLSISRLSNLNLMPLNSSFLLLSLDLNLVPRFHSRPLASLFASKSISFSPNLNFNFIITSKFDVYRFC